MFALCQLVLHQTIKILHSHGICNAYNIIDGQIDGRTDRRMDGRTNVVYRARER